MGRDANTPRLLFVTLSNIGDLVMTTPVLESLHALYPDHVIDVVADQRSGELLQPCPYLGELIWKNKRSSWSDKRKLFRKIRAHHYAVAVDLRGPWLARLARASKRARKASLEPGMHAVEHHFTALAKLSGSDSIPPMKLWLSQLAKDKANELITATPHKKWLAVAPGANWPGKIWPAEQYTAAINLLADSFDGVLVLGNNADMPLCRQVVAQSSLPSINLCGRTTLPETAACLAKATAFIGNDSGLGHMAAALGIPTLTVFGQGDPTRYRPWGNQAAVVLAPNKDLGKLAAEVVAAKLQSHLATL